MNTIKYSIFKIINLLKMSQEFKIEIISPDKSIFSGNTDEAILPCFEGQVTVLKDHIPLITFLRPDDLCVTNVSEMNSSP